MPFCCLRHFLDRIPRHHIRLSEQLNARFPGDWALWSSAFVVVKRMTIYCPSVVQDLKVPGKFEGGSMPRLQFNLSQVLLSKILVSFLTNPMHFHGVLYLRQRRFFFFLWLTGIPCRLTDPQTSVRDHTFVILQHRHQLSVLSVSASVCAGQNTGCLLSTGIFCRPTDLGFG